MGSTHQVALCLNVPFFIILLCQTPDDFTRFTLATLIDPFMVNQNFYLGIEK